MRKFLVNVNGTQYEVEVEEIAQNAAPKAKPASPAPVAAPAPTTKAAPVPAGGTTIAAPMPGNILAVNVAVGQAVKKGDVLVLLEAMKMENEIMAPADGTVTAVQVSKGATVDTGAALVTLG